jgi:hypothetical protein
MCAAPDTPIATPFGDRPIESLHVGDLVYSVDGDAIVGVPILAVGRRLVARHQVVRVELESGAVLEISPGHPTADGRFFAELSGSSWLDPQNRVLSAALVPFTHEATHDILPASDTGTYFAAGAWIGSTLFEAESTTLASPEASGRATEPLMSGVGSEPVQPDRQAKRR